jgi:hypothetical protein
MSRLFDVTVTSTNPGPYTVYLDDGTTIATKATGGLAKAIPLSALSNGKKIRIAAPDTTTNLIIKNDVCDTSDIAELPQPPSTTTSPSTPPPSTTVAPGTTTPPTSIPPSPIPVIDHINCQSAVTHTVITGNVGAPTYDMRDGVLVIELVNNWSNPPKTMVCRQSNIGEWVDPKTNYSLEVVNNTGKWTLTLKVLPYEPSSSGPGADTLLQNDKDYTIRVYRKTATNKVYGEDKILSICLPTPTIDTTCISTNTSTLKGTVGPIALRTGEVVTVAVDSDSLTGKLYTVGKGLVINGMDWEIPNYTLTKGAINQGKIKITAKRTIPKSPINYPSNSRTTTIIQTIDVCLPTPIPIPTSCKTTVVPKKIYDSNELEVKKYKFGQWSGKVTITYDAYKVKDQFKAYIDNVLIKDTGMISKTGTMIIDYPGNDAELSIEVLAGGTDASGWKYSMSCG